AQRHALLLGLGREFVPWADGEAVIAAEHAVADRFAEVARDLRLGLDGEIGKATARIELEGCGKGVGRADVETGPAAAAMLFVRGVLFKLRRREDGAEEEP